MIFLSLFYYPFFFLSPHRSFVSLLLRQLSLSLPLCLLGIFNIYLILREVVRAFHLVTEYLFDFFFCVCFGNESNVFFGCVFVFSCLLKFFLFLQEMERMEAGLKSSIRQEMALKTTPPVYEEFLAVTAAQNDFSSEDFSVDDLLDLSNDDVFVEEEEAAEPKAQQEVLPCVSSEQPNDVEEVLPPGNEFGSLPSNQLPVPVNSFLFP